MDRRTFLTTLGGGVMAAALSGCSERLLSLLDEGSEQLWGMNVHAYPEPLASLQVEALRALGIRRVRISLGLSRDLAGPYLASYGADWLGILTDYQLGGVTRRSWPRLVREVMDRLQPLWAVEVLNEPDLFLGLSAAEYVGEYLRPAWEIIKERRPSLPVVAAAPAGTQNGVYYFYRMTDAGADRYCDYRGVHLYSDSPGQYLYGTRKPFMVTESGTGDRGGHVRWWRETMAHISGVLDTPYLFYYALMESPPTGHNLIADAAGPDGRPLPVSPLYDYIRTAY